MVEGSIAPGTAYRLDESLEAVDERRTTLTVTATYELPLGALGRLAGRLGVERRVADELGDVVSGVRERAEASDRAAGRTSS